MPPGASLDDTLDVVRQIRSRLADLPEVASIFTTIGTQGGGNGFSAGAPGSVRKGTMTIQIDNVEGTRGAQQAFEHKATN